MPPSLSPWCLCLAALTSQAAPDRVQSPDAPWRTLPTAHYRIHHPDHAEFAAFAQKVASRIEGIHSLLEQEVGFALPGPTDVIIQNPLAAANGSVTPNLNRPVVTFWTEPIRSDSEISGSGEFVDLLVLHELVHLHHLTLPDRQSSRFWRRLSAGPAFNRVTRKSPGWIIEGYATYLEGRLGGAGRPHSAYRAMVMRQLAREGNLPTYKGLNGINLNLPSGIRYQAGSAFMEWLAAGHPKGSRLWPDLWQRLASRRYPTFESAFQATFGESPTVLYARYQAELTHSALELERRLSGLGLREGEIWGQAPGGFIRNLSVSPDGAFLLAQAQSKDVFRSGLHLYALGSTSKQAEKEQIAKAKAQAKDPTLPDAMEPRRKVRSPDQSLALIHEAQPFDPVWDADGVRYSIRVSTAEGVMTVQSGIWKPEGFKVAALVVRHIHPTKIPAGWQIEVKGRQIRLPFEPFGPVAYDETRQQLYASTPVEGIFNVVRYSFDGQTVGAPVVLTRMASGAFSPAPTPDGKHLYFIAPGGLGSQIRRLDLSQEPPSPASVQQDSSPFVADTVLSRAPEASQLPAPVPPPPGHAYRLSESHQWGPRIGMVVDPSHAAFQVGLGGNDVLGRLNWAALASLPLPGSEARGPKGVQLGAAWRGTTWEPSAHLFSSQTRPSHQRFEPVLGWDQERQGVEVALTREWWPQSMQGRVTFNAASERVRPLEGGLPEARRTQAGFQLSQRGAWNHHQLFAGASFSLLGQSGRTEGHSWNLARGAINLRAGWRKQSLGARYERGQVTGSPTELDLFRLGGQATGLLPRGLESNAIFQPALPTFSAFGNRFERWKALLGGYFWVEGTRLWMTGSPKPAYTRSVGFEIQDSVDAYFPFLRESTQRDLGRLQVRMGLQMPLDGPMKNRKVFTLGVIHRF